VRNLRLCMITRAGLRELGDHAESLTDTPCENLRLRMITRGGWCEFVIMRYGCSTAVRGPGCMIIRVGRSSYHAEARMTPAARSLRLCMITRAGRCARSGCGVHSAPMLTGFPAG